jgi:hypothetical protein
MLTRIIVRRLEVTKFLKMTAALAALALWVSACGGGGSESANKTAPGGGTTTAQTAPPKAATATIKGTIKYTGAPVTNPKIKMGADPYCDSKHPTPVFDESIVVGEGGTLENVFVYVKSGLEGQTFPTPTEPVVFDQRDCMYHPHIFGIMTHQDLEIVNSDATLHNVHASPTNSPEFNVGMPSQGMKVKKNFKKSEVMVHIKCEVHPWMSAYCGVLDHPYFTVAMKGGTFELPKIPAGTYTIEAWHEKLGTQTQQVTVTDGGTAEVNFTFGTAGT